MRTGNPDSGFLTALYEVLYLIQPIPKVLLPLLADTYWGYLTNFFNLHIYPYLATIIVLGILLWLGQALAGRSRAGSVKRAVFAEIRMNAEVSKSIMEYVETQKTGDPYVTPMPRFYVTAFENLKNQGHLFKLKRELRDDLVFIYMTMDRISEATDRQEELVVGAAAASPLAADLRSQNLAYIHNTVSNVVKPRLERLRTLYRF